MQWGYVHYAALVNLVTNAALSTIVYYEIRSSAACHREPHWTVDNSHRLHSRSVRLPFAIHQNLMVKNADPWLVARNNNCYLCEWLTGWSIVSSRKCSIPLSIYFDRRLPFQQQLHTDTVRSGKNAPLNQVNHFAQKFQYMLLKIWKYWKIIFLVLMTQLWRY